MMFNFLNRNFNIEDESIAVISHGRTYTYKELDNHINNTASILSEIYNITEGSHAAILCDNNFDFIVLISSLWRLHAVPVPLNVRLIDDELEKTIHHSQSKYCFIHHRYADRLKNLNNRYIFPLTVQTEKHEYENKQIPEDSDALIMYTSGSSGNPKGVILSYSNLYCSAENTVTTANQTSHDRWIASLPFYHIGGLQIITRTFLHGSSIVLPELVNAGNIIKIMNKFNPTLASLVSTVLHRFVELGLKPNPELRYTFLGGGPLDAELINSAMALGWNIIKVYGSTETSSMVTALKCSPSEKNISSSGKVIDNTIIKIVNDSGESLPSFKEGEITVSGNTVMKGYWKNEIETAARLNNGFYYTGDIGYLDDLNYLFVEARRSDLIISGGENINPSEIELLLLKHGWIKDACVFPVADNDWGQIAAAAISLKKGITLTENSIRDYLKEKISSYKIPKKYFFIDKMPRNELGKINRNEVRNMFEK